MWQVDGRKVITLTWGDLIAGLCKRTDNLRSDTQLSYEKSAEVIVLLEIEGRTEH
jgi:hypothetical protein